jgi:mannose/fructose-specific phosphotransferase system component IIA
VEGVAGVNLPMLLRVACYNSKPLGELMQRALDGGRECIVTIDSEGCDATTGCSNY